MALQKSKSLSHGLIGNYWKITNVQVDKRSLKLKATISLFRSKQHSDDGESSLSCSHTLIKKFTKQQLGGDITALAYNMFKSVAAEQPQASLVDPENKNRIIADLSGSEDV